MASTTGRRSAQTRLPVDGPQSRAAEVGLGLLALGGTLAIVLGVPWLLLRAFDPPWPTEPPSTSWFTEQVGTDTILLILSVVVWLAWAHLVVCLVVEAVTEVRGQGLAPRVPGGGIGTQALARRVVTLALLLVGAGSTAVPMATATSTDAGLPPAVATAPAHGPALAAHDVRDGAPSGALAAVVPADSMYATLARHGSPVGAGPTIDALVDELLPGYPRRAA